MVDRIYRVVINEEASAMLEEHLSFLAQVNLEAAKFLRQDMLVRFKALGKMPHLYPVFYSNSLETEYRKLVFKRYLILYTIDETEKVVRIDFIWDSRKNNRL